ncbi:unnamed protein product [Linum trigynum]|uniref:Uncharacterized protein n=1 Tax=Linum trigynum TaxID=586398 RepID=A0AAV2F233_9ROSI
MTSSNPKFWPPPNLPAECREQHAATKSSRLHSRRRPNRDPVSIPVAARPPPATPLLCASKSPPPRRAPTFELRIHTARAPPSPCYSAPRLHIAASRRLQSCRPSVPPSSFSSALRVVSTFRQRRRSTPAALLLPLLRPFPWWV